MGLFDSPDGDMGDFGEFINEMMNRQREAQLNQRHFTLFMGAYMELMGVEPENRTANQDVIVHFAEMMMHHTVASLGWCENDTPEHIEEHTATMRATAIQSKQEWDALMESDPVQHSEVQGWINRTVEGIDK